jgi:hypothetical protein
MFSHLNQTNSLPRQLHIDEAVGGYIALPIDAILLDGKNLIRSLRLTRQMLASLTKSPLMPCNLIHRGDEPFHNP